MSAVVKPYIRTEPAPAMPPPSQTVGPVHWIRENMFPNWWSSILTLLGLYLIYAFIISIVDWAFVKSVWTGSDRNACLGGHGEEVGACWAFVSAKLGQFIYGRYPETEIWRVNIVYFTGLVLLVPMLIPPMPLKKLNAVLLLGMYPVMTLILLTGGGLDFSNSFWIGLGIIIAIILAALLFLSLVVKSISLQSALIGWVVTGALSLALFLVLDFDFGLMPVETPLWGGLLVTLVVAVTGITASLPLGILLALGRRSRMAAIRLFSIGFIEMWRGIPLITVLFMSSVMLPLFLPEGVNFDKLLRALIGVALFTSAYMAETIRGGLQAIPKGQYEGAMSLGLRYGQMTRLIILPQALKMVIPGIVNVFISLFKDTTLVLIIGLFDLLGIIQFHAQSDANWFTPVTNHTGYVFAAVIFWIFCFGMSRYSLFMERRLHTGHKR
jgi:general L-amino acid transport system permease protein